MDLKFSSFKAKKNELDIKRMTEILMTNPILSFYLLGGLEDRLMKSVDSTKSRLWI